MRNLLALAAAAALTFAGVGWYLNWYSFHTEVKPTGHRNVNIDFNTVKIVEDVHKGVKKGEEKLQRLRDSKPTSPDQGPPPKGATAQAVVPHIPLRVIP